MQKTIAGATIDVNEEGFLTDPSQWNEAVAAALAAEESVGPLTEAHWKVLHHLRAKHAAGEEVTIRQLGKSGVVTTKDLYALFPNGPLKKAARIAGVPKPVGCI
ncbi:MAG: TusE/DsrC/DsvC family sulfur relay protein [Verrucomicrobiales bacterium]|nr:TusE/DsrC/DsvC family sulfur relay protein [Verrucomicrobiales bacterium]